MPIFLLSRKLFTSLFAVWCCFIMTTWPCRAQDTQPTPQPTPPNARVKELEERISILEKEKQKAELEKELVVAQSARIRALLPTPTATPLEGKVDIDEHVKLESEILTYQALSELLQFAAGRIGGVSPKPTSVVIYSDRDVAALQNYNTLKAQIDSTTQRYGEILPGGAEAGPAGILLAPEMASTLLRSVADVAALFRTNTTIGGLTFTVEEGALVSQLSKALKAISINSYYPSVYPPNLFSKDTPAIIKSLSDLYVQKSKSELIVSRCESTENDVKALCNANKDTVLRLKALNQQVSKFIDELSVVDDTTKSSALTGMVRAENLRNIFQGSDSTYILQVKVLDAAGSNKRTSNLFTGTKLSHSGGIIVNFILFEKNGMVMLSDTLYNYKGFIRVKSETGNLVNNLRP